MGKIALIKAEIERLQKYNHCMADNAINSNMRNFYDGEEDCCKQLLSFISTLKESEISNDLEEAAVDIADSLLAKPKNYVLSAKADYWNGVHDGVIAGAKWQEEKDTRDMYMSDNRHFEKVYQLGRTDMREQMLKDSVEGEIYKLGEAAYVKECNNAELTKYLSRFNNGDKVKIIVIHETDIR